MQALTDSSLIQPIQHTSRVNGLYKNRLDQDMCGASRAAVVRALICLSATWTSVFSENANHCIASVQPKYSKDLEQPKKLSQMLTNDQFVVETFTRLASSTFTVAAPKIPPGRQLRLPHQQIQWAIETPAGPTNLQRGHMSSPRSWSITTAMPSRLKTRRPWKASASSPLWLKTNAIQPSSQWHFDIPGIAKKEERLEPWLGREDSAALSKLQSGQVVSPVPFTVTCMYVHHSLLAICHCLWPCKTVAGSLLKLWKSSVHKLKDCVIWDVCALRCRFLVSSRVDI